jgi:hypothetical protein
MSIRSARYRDLERKGAGVRVGFGVLGPVTAWNGTGDPIALKGPRHRAVLARLIVARRRVVPVDLLVDDLWDEPPPGAVSAVRTFVAALRRALEPGRPPRRPATLLVTEGPGYALRAATDDVDAWRAEEAVKTAAALPPPDAVTRLEEALGWWRGPAYADFADQRWARADRSRLAELRLRRALPASASASRFDEPADASSGTRDVASRGTRQEISEGLRAGEPAGDGGRGRPGEGVRDVGAWVQGIGEWVRRSGGGVPGGRIDWGPYEPWARPLVLLGEGRARQAAAALREVPDPPHDLLQEALWCLAGRAALLVGDGETAERAHTELLPAAGEWVGAGSGVLSLGPVAAHLTDLAAALGRAREAAAHRADFTTTHRAGHAD